MALSDTINAISQAFADAENKVTYLERNEGEKIASVVYGNLTIENYDEMDSTIRKANVYRSDFVAGMSKSISELAKTEFEEHEDVTHVESSHELGGEKLTVTVVREDKRLNEDEDEVETIHNNIRVFSESELCTCLDDIRTMVFE